MVTKLYLILNKVPPDLQEGWDVLNIEGVQETRTGLVGGASTQLHLDIDWVDDGQRRLLLTAQPTWEHLRVTR